MPAEDRSVQAEDRLYAMEYNEVETRKKLDLNGYKFAPRLLGLKVTKQDEGGIVPHGFIAFQLIQIVPGVGLGQVYTEEGRNSAYWESPPETREEIRQAFRTPWEYVFLFSYDSIPGLIYCALGLAFLLGFHHVHGALTISRGMRSLRRCR